MTIFGAVKTTVTPRMAAEHFGLSVSRNGMVCCPFHDDQHPSMKLYEDHYHCFGCQANGDVIAFTSKLFGITPLEAAQKLAADFGIREDRPSVLAKLKMYTTQAENEKLCFRVLSEYLHILQDWKKRYAPQAPEEEPDDRFVEACHMLECTCKTSENRKEICAAAKRFRETVLLGIEYRLHGCAWVCMVSCEVTRFREVDTPHLRRGHRPPLFQRISGKQNITSHSEAGFRKRKPASLFS